MELDWHLSHARWFRYIYVPYGPTLVDSSQLAFALRSLKQAAQGMGVDFVRCEPVGADAAELARLGLRKVGSVQPEHSLVIDLSADVVTLRHGLNTGHRNAVNQAADRGIRFTTSQDRADLETFLDLLRLTVSRQHFRSHPAAYFESMVLEPGAGGRVGLAYAEDSPVAGEVCFDFHDSRA